MRAPVTHARTHAHSLARSLTRHDALCSLDMTSSPRFFGAVEAGGTKFICAVVDERENILVQERFPTTDPNSTLAAVHPFLREQGGKRRPLLAIGVACFGPVELDKSSPRYGFIGQTPKRGWSNTDVAGSLAREFRIPVGFDTDTNAAALAEHRWGAARELQLDDAHPQWEIEADYLGQLCEQLVLTVSPQRIIMGGGVMGQSRLLPLIRGPSWRGSLIMTQFATPRSGLMLSATFSRPCRRCAH
jgi:predicted NBD/HSP70 family sugar kinase